MGKIEQNEPFIPAVSKRIRPSNNSHVNSNLQIIVTALEMEQEHAVTLQEMQKDILNA